MSTSPVGEVLYAPSYSTNRFVFLFVMYLIIRIIDFISSSVLYDFPSLKIIDIVTIKNIVLSGVNQIRDGALGFVVIEIIMIIFVIWFRDWLYLFYYSNHLIFIGLFVLIAYSIASFMFISGKIFSFGALTFIFLMSVLFAIMASSFDMPLFVYNDNGIIIQTIQSFRYNEYIFAVDYNKGKLKITPQEVVSGCGENEYDSPMRKLKIFKGQSIKSDVNIPFGIYMFYYPDMAKGDVVLNICTIINNKVVEDMDIGPFSVWLDSYILPNLNKALQKIKTLQSK